MKSSNFGVFQSSRIQRRRLFLLATVCFGLVPRMLTATVQELYSFPAVPSVRSTLVEGTDGAFYGTTAGSGAYGLGSVFRVTTNGVFSTLMSFDWTNGALPSRTLMVASDGTFYGTTSAGGSNNDGTVFRLSQQGQLTTVFSFQTNRPDSSGLFPGTDGAFYGMNFQELNYLLPGESFISSIFKLSSNRITWVTSLTLTNPLSGPLMQAADGAFYGTLALGGSFGLGSVFRVAANREFSTVASFDGTLGSEVNPGLVQGADGRLYGTTSSGGSNGFGTVFALTTNGILTDIISVSDTNGPLYSYAPLIRGADGALYGTIPIRAGTCFRATTNGELILFGSLNQTNGTDPWGALVEGADGAFYGTTFAGGSQGYGTIFRATPDGAVTTLASFIHPDPAGPIYGVVQGSNGDWYGTTDFGGTNNGGTIFQIGAGGVEKTLASFPVGAGPLGGLAEAPDGNFYGTTYPGNVFRMTEDGILTTIAAMTNGPGPTGGLLLGNDGAFYGTTSWGGDFNMGTVFRVTTNGELSTFAEFESTNGLLPNGDLVQGSDGALYGTTQFGAIGTNGDGNGTVFRVNTNGGLTTLFAFDGTNGARPSGLLQGPDGALYGTTSKGGRFSLGTVFRLGTNGGLTTLVTFDGTNGAVPIGGLVQGPDGALYGTTPESEGGFGTAYRVTTNGVFTTIASFDSFLLGDPVSTMCFGEDGALYGTTGAGGTHGGGSIFRLSFDGQMQSLVRVGSGWQVIFTGIPGAGYRVLRATDLTGPWEQFTNATVGVDGSGQFTDSVRPATQTFYRVAWP